MSVNQHVVLNFRPVYGGVGDIVYATVRPGVPFRPEKLVARDDGNGVATLIRQIYVDGEPLFPPPRLSWWRRIVEWFHRHPLDRGIPTVAFAANAVGNGLPGDAVCPAGQSIDVEIEFLANSGWTGSIIGEGLRE